MADRFEVQNRRAAELFEQRFGSPPQWIVAAPGRVNLIGEHTDYNGGFVLPMAIERRTVIAAGPSGGPIRLHSELEGDAELPLASPMPKGAPPWTNYLRGVIAASQQRGVKVPAFDAVIDSEVPLGSGLSSSAALEVSTATLIERMTGHTFEPLDKVLLCQWAEHNYAGMPCGIMDQYISALGKRGHALLIDCRSNESQHVPLADPGIAILIANTNVKHELTGSEYPTRRRQCEEAARAMGYKLLREAKPDDLDRIRGKVDGDVFRRARHVIGEDQRTLGAVAAMRAGDWATMGRLMYESHASLRNDFEVSTKELDLMVDLAASLGESGGVYGSRMTGGGFGGCTVSLVKADLADAIASHLRTSYQPKTGIEPMIFVSKPADGATVIA
jgi:galactokinase